MGTLYIIGNGFDRHHGMQTSYYDFAEYIKHKHSHLYDLLETYINYPSSDNDLWSKFEENLANLDVENILAEHEDRLPNFMSDDFRSRDMHIFPDIMDETLDSLTTNLISIFKQFILDVEIPKSANNKRLRLEKGALFFSFNYTSTLEDLYHIDSSKILHIHNIAGSKYYEIILGHGIDPAKLEMPRELPPANLAEAELEEWYAKESEDYDYSYDTGKETIYKYFKRSYKPTKEIIEEHFYYFASLYEITSVYILGHSLSDVDLPYVQKIKDSVNINAIWHVSYYGAKEKVSHLKTLLNLGIKKENVRMFTLNKLQIANKQLDLEL